MKGMRARKLILSIAAMFFLLAVCGLAAVEDSRKLTIMVYMCGSDLESSYNLATQDIQEMILAETDKKSTSLLVMTGGAAVSSDSGYFLSDKAQIFEIGTGNKRRIYCSEVPMNMGNQETLSFFLRYCMENRPAEKYALILWDHGGGPLEGVCWDEVSGMDHLSLSELAGAFKEAEFTDKLSWIGFDACLMGSLEVAGKMVPYAEYMVASQETEPSFGWNYAFLNGIEEDLSGAETGQHIVDAFFEDKDDSKEILTMSCVDLSRVSDVITALGLVFSPLGQHMDKERFLSLSGLRMKTTSFGKSVSEALSTGYDLVDIRDLVSRLEPTQETANLLRLLDQAIVYHRSSETGANGLTLYHPYKNIRNYKEKWKTGYQELNFCPEYQEYVNAFGSMLTGESLFQWINLIPVVYPEDESGNYLFEMQLTKEQAENVVAAQLMILMDFRSDELDRNCLVLNACPAEIRENNTLMASWDGKLIYVEAEDGSILSNVSASLSDDGRSRWITGKYTAGEYYAQKSQTVQFELNAEDTSVYPSIVRSLIWDEATGCFTSRIPFQEEGYRYLYFWHQGKICPKAGDSQTLPAMMEWPDNLVSSAATCISLPAAWRFRSMKSDPGKQYFAMFRLLDSQQKEVCSVPVKVPAIQNPTHVVLSEISDPALIAGSSERTEKMSGQEDLEARPAISQTEQERIDMACEMAETMSPYGHSSYDKDSVFAIFENKNQDIQYLLIPRSVSAGLPENPRYIYSCFDERSHLFLAMYKIETIPGAEQANQQIETAFKAVEQALSKTYGETQLMEYAEYTPKDFSPVEVLLLAEHDSGTRDNTQSLTLLDYSKREMIQLNSKSVEIDHLCVHWKKWRSIVDQNGREEYCHYILFSYYDFD